MIGVSTIDINALINIITGLLSVLINGITGLLSVILTGFLVYFYREMRDTQQEQTRLQRRQIKIQENQQEIEENQTKIQKSQAKTNKLHAELKRGQNRPYIFVNEYSAVENSFLLDVSNQGEGMLKRGDIINSVYVSISDAIEMGWEFSSEDSRLEYLTESKLIKLSEVESETFNLHVSKSVLRPEIDTNDIISIEPDGENLYCYSNISYNMSINGEYNELSFEEMIEELEKIGLSTVYFTWVLEYRDLSGVSYFEYVTSSKVDLEECSELQDAVSNDRNAAIEDNRTSTLNYHELPHNIEE